MSCSRAPARAECRASETSSPGVRAEASSSAGSMPSARTSRLATAFSGGDHRAEEAGEGVLRARDETHDLQRLGHRPVLGHQLADHHLHGRGQQHADDHGDTGDGALGDAGREERAVQQLGERGLGEHADDERGDGDAELGAGELEGQLLERLDDRTGPSVALGGGLLGVGRLDRHQAELGRHEESVGENQQERRSEEQQGDGHDAAACAYARIGSAVCRQGAAQVLQDDPSIAGEGHSSGSWNPWGAGRRTGAEAQRIRLRHQINQDRGVVRQGGAP